MTENLKFQIDELILHQPKLIYKDDTQHELVIIEGSYEYNLYEKKFVAKGEKKIKIIIPYSFPSEQLNVYIMERRPYKFSHFFVDGRICVAASGEINYFLTTSPSIEDYLDRFLNPFIFSLDWFDLYNTYPFEERSHGAKGLLEYYLESYNLTVKGFVNLAEIFISKKEMVRSPIIFQNNCFCGSGIQMRKCHGSFYRTLVLNELTIDKFTKEAKTILYYLKNSN